MAIDTGIFAQSGKPAVTLDDPSDQLQKLMAVQGQVNANKLFQGQSAAGAAAQAAIDPVTGRIDPDKLNRLLASNPSIAPAAMQALQQGNVINGGQTDNQIKRRAAVAQQAVGLLTKSDAELEGGQALHTQFDNELNSGHMTQTEHDTVLQAAPPLGSSAAAVRQFLMRAAVSNMDPTAALTAATSTPDIQGTGQVNQPGLRAGVANPNAPGSFTPSGPGIGQVLTPSQKTSQVTRIGPNGEEITETLGTRLGQQGDTQFLGGQNGGKAFPAKLVPDGYTGRHPGNTSPGAVPGAPAVAPVAPGGAVVTSLAPGAKEAAIATSAASAEQGVNLQKAADGSTDRHAMLANMESDLNGFTSGPAAERQKNYSAFVNRNLPVLSGLIPGVQSNQSVAAQEQFEKMAKQIALAQSGSLGSTDAKLETSLGANPNSGLSQLGNKQIIAMLHGNEDAITAKNQAWQQYQATNGAGAYGKFSTDFNKSFDPRAYQLMRMDPADARRMVSEMKPEARAVFKSKSDAMEQAGLIAYPGRGTAQPAQQQAQPAPGLEPSQMPSMTPPPVFGGPPNRMFPR